MENCDLYDNKEIFLHITEDKSKYFEFVNAKDPNNAYYVLFREWDPESWNLGPIIEVKVDKQAYSNKLGIFLAEKIFQHIPPEYL